MNLKRIVAAVALSLVTLGTGLGIAAGHDTAGSEGIWPAKYKPTISSVK